MVWISTRKAISITKTASHDCPTPGTGGRALVNSTVQFSPLEFYGAAARCSHLHHIDPALTTPEANLMAALFERYVDDAGSEFAILATSKQFKDYIKSFFSGTAAAALAYLTMIQDQYVWADHFENVAGGNPNETKSPDFMFTGHGVGTALLESKGTTSRGASDFDSRVQAGYYNQVEPHLGHAVHGLLATHGFCIGSWLTPSLKAELFVHHTAPAPVGASGGPRPRGAAVPASGRVQLANYATALTLVAGATLGDGVRRGALETTEPFLRLQWRGRGWLSGLRRRAWRRYPLDDARRLWRLFPSFMTPDIVVALDEEIATTLFRWIGGGKAREGAEPLPVQRMPEDVIGSARATFQDEPAAVLPDGLAVFASGAKFEDISVVRWSGANFVEDQ